MADPLDVLRHHVTGAIERGEKQAIVEKIAAKPVREFTEVDVVRHTNYPRIYADRAELIDAPTAWQKMGLQQTATGYGNKLNSGLKIRYCGRDYRIYTTCYSNAGSSWFRAKGEKIYVS